MIVEMKVREEDDETRERNETIGIQHWKQRDKGEGNQQK